MKPDIITVPQSFPGAAVELVEFFPPGFGPLARGNNLPAETTHQDTAVPERRYAGVLLALAVIQHRMKFRTKGFSPIPGQNIYVLGGRIYVGIITPFLLPFLGMSKKTGQGRSVQPGHIGEGYIFPIPVYGFPFYQTQLFSPLFAAQYAAVPPGTFV
jgi:hypothetical protein